MNSAWLAWVVTMGLVLAGAGMTVARDFRKVAFYRLVLGLLVGAAFWIEGQVWSALSEWIVGGLVTVLLIWFTALTGTERSQPRLWQWIGMGALALALSVGIVLAFGFYTGSPKAEPHDLGFIETSIGLLVLLWFVWIGAVAQSRPEVLEKERP